MHLVCLVSWDCYQHVKEQCRKRLFRFDIANVDIKKDPDKKESCRGIRGGKVNFRVNF